MKQKGQGALEYLLLIGGAVLIAVIVITLLLGIGNTGQGQTEATSAAALCVQKAVTASPSNPACAITGSPDVTVSGSGNTYTCAGTYPNCTATKCGASPLPACA